MLSFTTKAKTLAALEPLVKTCSILPQVCFTVAEWATSPQVVMERIFKAFDAQPVIVRSSSLSEDSTDASQAGKYLSIANVKGAQEIKQAIRDVISAFGQIERVDQVFVQPYLSSIALCGVVFTVDPNTGGNYFIVNYDSTGSTDSVTSGNGMQLETYYQFRDTPDSVLSSMESHPVTEGRAAPEQLQRVLLMARELMDLFSTTHLDIEFALTKDNVLYLLQVRPLIVKQPESDLLEQASVLQNTYSFIAKCMQPQPYVFGKRSIYGVMPDWNPAEMIGIRPRPLALSLYRRLITDGTWAYQRNNYGYRNLRSCPLLLDFAGLPYIDTRVSFNSFIPKSVPEDLCEKLANYYLDALSREPDKHDKIEFDIIFSCYTFDLQERSSVLLEHGFTMQEVDCLRDSLLALTNQVMDEKDGLLIKDIRKIDILEERQKKMESSDLDLVSKIYWLLEDCARYGTLPFAGLARAGFIAVQMLKSLVRIGILQDSDYENYMASLQTVNSCMAHDMAELSRDAFLRKYGHLRPGTYDIQAKRYIDAPNIYFTHLGEESEEKQPEYRKKCFQLTLEQYGDIQRKMKAQGIQGDVLSLFAFIKSAIEGRESSKFVFTRSISMILELLAQLGEDYSFTRDDMSYFDVRVMSTLYSSVQDTKRVLSESIAKGKARYQKTLGLTMPAVILSPNDIFCFHLMDTIPNFITLQIVEAPICYYLENRAALKDKILLIPAADPGYDWIFSTGIKGFVTAYGGANSHMAIRAGEVGLPAAIGIGEKLFAQLQHANVLLLDCANKRMEVLR